MSAISGIIFEESYYEYLMKRPVDPLYTYAYVPGVDRTASASALLLFHGSLQSSGINTFVQRSSSLLLLSLLMLLLLLFCFNFPPLLFRIEFHPLDVLDEFRGFPHQWGRLCLHRNPGPVLSVVNPSNVHLHAGVAPASVGHDFNVSGGFVSSLGVGHDAGVPTGVLITGLVDVQEQRVKFNCGVSK